MILKNYTYSAACRDDEPWMQKEDKFKVFGKDEDDNNILHHCYANQMADIRQMLRNNNFLDQGSAPLEQSVNEA